MRRRLLAWSAVVLVVSVVAFAVPLAVVVRGVLRDRALDELQAQVLQLGGVLDRQSRTCGGLRLLTRQVTAPPTTFSVWTVDGDLVVASGPSGGVIGDEFGTAARGGVGRALDQGRVAVAAPLDTGRCGRPLVVHASRPDDHLRSQVGRAWASIASVGLAVLALTGAAAWWLAGWFTRPLERLASAARRLGDGDFGVAVPRSDLPEADAIAAALEVTADRLGRAMQRSAAFTADASHQLRTPLTALQLHVERLEASGADPDAVADAHAEVQRLAATIDELVALTRISGVDADLDLGAFVAERVRPWRALAAEQGRTVVVEVEPVPPVRVRAAALGQAFDVLLDNALRHGDGTVSVRVAPGAPRGPQADAGRPVAVEIAVVDRGRGIDPRFGDGRTRRDQGGGPLPLTGGRGLVLARALLDAEGCDLSVTGDRGGTRAVIRVPAAQVRDAGGRWDEGA